MELLIVKNGHVYARANDESAASEDVFELRTEAEIPEYPAEKAGKGKSWKLDYINDELTWVAVDRPLTQEERLEKVEQEIAEQKYSWKAGEAVNVSDKRFYDGKWYECVQAHTTLSNWTPDVTPALWMEAMM